VYFTSTAAGGVSVYPPCVVYQNLPFCPAGNDYTATLSDGGDTFDLTNVPYNLATVNGGAGNDAIVGGNATSKPEADVFNGGGGNDTVIGSPGPDTVHGGDGNDAIWGGNGNDQLYGDAGNDTIIGGPGNDLENGGAGNDTMGWDVYSPPYIYTGTLDEALPPGPDDSGADTYVGGGGDDEVTYDQATVGVNVSLDGVANDGQPGEGDNVGTDIDHVVGTRYQADTLTGGAGPVTLEGQGGDDTLTAGTGKATLDGGDDNDTLYGGPNADTLIGGAGDDTINTAGPSGTGADTIYGDYEFGCGYYACAAGNDTINADDGVKQSISCGPGADTANIDALDTVAADPTQACETVNRSNKTGPGNNGNNGSSGGKPPAILSAKLRSRSASSRQGIGIQVKLAGDGTLDVLITKRVQRHHHTKWSAVGLGSVKARAGINRFTIKKVHGHRLAPGVYRLILFTVRGRVRSRARTLTVTVNR
jgi:Ca2+-binding RTX toxin-like protein